MDQAKTLAKKKVRRATAMGRIQTIAPIQRPKIQ